VPKQPENKSQSLKKWKVLRVSMHKLYSMCHDSQLCYNNTNRVIRMRQSKTAQDIRKLSRANKLATIR